MNHTIVNNHILNHLNHPCFQGTTMSPSTAKIINEAKRRDRPSINLQDWNKHNYWQRSLLKELVSWPNDIQRQSVDSLTVQRFKDQYLRNKKPVLITEGCTQSWKPQQFWQHDSMLKRFQGQLFKIGQDDDGQKIKVTMKTFLEYLVHNIDDSPMYLFQNTNIVNVELQTILESYKVPPYFTEDVLSLLDDKDRPLFRWFLMGPERSGSPVHTDPLMTNAWNTSLVGHKRWVLFSQDTPKYIVKGKEFRNKEYSDEAITYFTDILPKIKQKYSKENLGLVQFIQAPGETVFIPAGIWHAVLNLDDTVAVTQNFVSRNNFKESWQSILQQRKQLAPLLLQKLKQNNQQLYLIARQLSTNEKSIDLSLSANEIQKLDSFISRSFKDTDKQVELETEQKTNRPRVSSDTIKNIQKLRRKTFSEKEYSEEEQSF